MALLREWLSGVSICAGGNGENIVEDLPPCSIEGTVTVMATQLRHQGEGDYQASKRDAGLSNNAAAERLAMAVQAFELTLHALAHVCSLWPSAQLQFRHPWARAAATLSHLYLTQHRPDRCIDLACECLRRASNIAETDEAGKEIIILARITLLKAYIRQGSGPAVRVQVYAILSSPGIDQTMIAAVCEELSAAGPPFLAGATAILERFVEHAHEAQLAAAVRALVSMRLREIAALDAASADASAMRAALMSDIECVARRVRSIDISDDAATHVEWLADQAYHQARLSALDLGRADFVSIRRVADLLDAACLLAGALPPTGARLQMMLCGRTVIVRCWLRLATMGQQPQHLSASLQAQEHLTASRAQEALADAWRLLESLRSPSFESMPAVPVDGLLALECEFAIRNDDPIASTKLNTVEVTNALTAVELRCLADAAHQHGHPLLEIRALELALSRLLDATPRTYAEIAQILRTLIRRGPPEAAQANFDTALRSLRDRRTEEADEPRFGDDEVVWFLAEAWNRGVTAFLRDGHEEAVRWMALAHGFSEYCSTGKTLWRECEEVYQRALQLGLDSSQHATRIGNRPLRPAPGPATCVVRAPGTEG